MASDRDIAGGTDVETGLVVAAGDMSEWAEALEGARVPATTRIEALDRADAYFMVELGWSLDEPTKIPLNRHGFRP